MGMLLRSNGDLQASAVALVIDVCNMWEVSMEGSHIPFLTALHYNHQLPMVHFYLDLLDIHLLGSISFLLLFWPPS
jgi:hypothetical protein